MTIRVPNEVRVYLRCSSTRQESSLATQLTWAIATAAERGIRLRATLEDLDHMKRHRLFKYKDLYVDDAVSGTRTKRPGFDAMLCDLKADPRISHLLVFKRDRLGRPRNALHMVMVEDDLQEEGIVIVTSEGIIDPTTTGSARCTQSVMSILGFHESGEFSRKLSERILLTHIALARKGYSTGGRAPYGFGRFLEKPDGSFEEIPRGRGVNPHQTPATDGTTTVLSTRFLACGRTAPSWPLRKTRSSPVLKRTAGSQRAFITVSAHKEPVPWRRMRFTRAEQPESSKTIRQSASGLSPAGAFSSIPSDGSGCRKT